MTPGITPDRSARLRRVKLAALMSDRGLAAEHVTTTGLCAATAADQAWVLLDGEPGRGLGGAVAYAASRSAAEVHVVAEAGTGVLARRADAFALPIHVWHHRDRTLIPAIAEPLPAVPPPRAEHLALSDVIRAGGADPVVEHGVVAGEVDGLEVCRVVDDPLTGEVRLEVGVGAHDRETFQLLHGNLPTVEALRTVVASVAAHRRPGADPHPLNLLAAERSLRQRVINEPGLIGALALRPADPPVARRNLNDTVPCVAIATIGTAEVVAVFSAGVDLDVVPFATDARLAHHLHDAVIVLPRRDALDVQRRIAGQLHRPIDIVGLASI